MFLGAEMIVEIRNQNTIKAEQSIQKIKSVGSSVAKGFNNFVARGPFPEAGQRGDQFINSIMGDNLIKSAGFSVKESLEVTLQPTRVNYNFFIRIFENNTKSTC